MENPSLMNIALCELQTSITLTILKKQSHCQKVSLGYLTRGKSVSLYPLPIFKAKDEVEIRSFAFFIVKNWRKFFIPKAQNHELKRVILMKLREWKIFILHLKLHL